MTWLEAFCEAFADARAVRHLPRDPVRQRFSGSAHWQQSAHIALTTFSVTFLASPSSIMVLSR
jgi:hypothetical protein